MKKLIATAAGFFALLPGLAPGQGARSFSSSDWMTFPHREEVPAQRVPAPLFSGVPEAALQEQVVVLRATIEELSQSLALANAEAETFKRQTEELALKLDALGLVGLEGRPESLEQKLLTAVRDLRQEQARSLSLEEALLGLTESIIAMLQETEGVSPETRLDIEARMRRTNELLGMTTGIAEAPAVEATLTNALVVDTRPQLALVILNVGRAQGVRIGTPFRILRGESLIGSALVVDVRERISGAIIQSLEQEDNNPRLGDRARVITR
jgi:hypothetical protein